MKLPFEKWLEAQAVGSEGRAAFAEAVVCYKAGAYRAALLYSYLGWGRTLRERLLGAACPAAIPAGLWGQIQAALLNSDTWDDSTFESTQRHNNPAPIFLVQPNVRDQVRYWRDRRNDCAHYKQNDITEAHVEAFWGFLRSNLALFVPNGSAAALLQEIEAHYNANLNPPGQDISPITARVPAAVMPNDRAQFFTDITTRLVGALGTPRTAEQAEVFCSLFQQGDPGVTQDLATFILGNDPVLLAVLRAQPRRVLQLNATAPQIRHLWMQLLFDGGGRDLPVLATLLRNGQIPPAQQADAVQRAVERGRGQIPDPADLPALRDAGYLTALRNYAFIVTHAINIFVWGNANAELAAWYVLNNPIDDDVARCLCGVFSATPYPFQAQASLQRMFQANAPKLAELARVAQGLNLAVPATLQ